MNCEVTQLFCFENNIQMSLISTFWEFLLAWIQSLSEKVLQGGGIFLKWGGKKNKKGKNKKGRERKKSFPVSSLRLNCLSLHPCSIEVNFIIKFSLIGLCQWGVLSWGGKWHRSYRKTETMSQCPQSQLLSFHIYLLHKHQALLFHKNIKT